MNPAPNWGFELARQAVAAGRPGIWVMWVLGAIFALGWISSGHLITALAALMFFSVAAIWHVSKARAAYAADRMQRSVREREAQTSAPERDEEPKGA